MRTVREMLMHALHEDCVRLAIAARDWQREAAAPPEVPRASGEGGDGPRLGEPPRAGDGDVRVRRACLFGGLRRLKSEVERAQCTQSDGDARARDADVASRKVSEMRGEVLRVFSICDREYATEGPRGDDERPAAALLHLPGRAGDPTPIRVSAVETHLV